MKMNRIISMILLILLPLCSGCIDTFLNTWEATEGRSYRQMRNSGRYQATGTGIFYYLDGTTKTLSSVTQDEFNDIWREEVNNGPQAITNKEWTAD